MISGGNKIIDANKIDLDEAIDRFSKLKTMRYKLE